VGLAGRQSGSAVGQDRTRAACLRSASGRRGAGATLPAPAAPRSPSAVTIHQNLPDLQKTDNLFVSCAPVIVRIFNAQLWKRTMTKNLILKNIPLVPKIVKDCRRKQPIRDAQRLFALSSESNHAPAFGQFSPSAWRYYQRCNKLLPDSAD